GILFAWEKWGLSVGFLVSLPQRGRGPAIAVDEESQFPFGSGYDVSWRLKGFRIHPDEQVNPLSSSTTCGGPPSPLGKAHEETQQPDKPQFET
ncbi:MAG: hypothetical protein IJ363_12400, partial [Clostridia bacterium]|nr:hypothetical protein [Clostridia bacterium]